eukprot:TRINITY_DN7731_c0_g1_i1.p1 TRINITY_DN7731_c0_g1~~TRINITY_DN7731_c0_g1_i1.p1  ORF type:complete len:70 (-),score=4.76 TRINITY_DN7731_c0_g1_i1:249-458(-)
MVEVIKMICTRSFRIKGVNFLGFETTPRLEDLQRLTKTCKQLQVVQVETMRMTLSYWLPLQTIVTMLRC